jgi:hypothetical protein
MCSVWLQQSGLMLQENLQDSHVGVSARAGTHNKPSSACMFTKSWALASAVQCVWTSPTYAHVGKCCTTRTSSRNYSLILQTVLHGNLSAKSSSSPVLITLNSPLCVMSQGG